MSDIQSLRYCRLDQYGDLEDTIRMVQMPGKSETIGASAIVLNRELLARSIAQIPRMRQRAMPVRKLSDVSGS